MNNCLITSVSAKIPLVKAVKRAMAKFDSKAKVIGGDCNPNCIARYFTDDFIELPRQARFIAQYIYANSII